MGKLLSRMLLYAIHDIARFASGQDIVAYCRRVTGARASAGNRYGPAGNTSGNAHLKWACAEAAVLVLRKNPAGQQPRARVENQPGQGQALTILAHKLA
jgi:transposase